MGKEENTAEEAGPTPELEVSWKEEGKEHLHGSFWGRGCPRSYALEQTQAECVCVCVCNWEAGGKVCRWEGMQGRGVERGGGERTACMKLQTKDRKWWPLWWRPEKFHAATEHLKRPKGLKEQRVSLEKFSEGNGGKTENQLGNCCQSHAR